MLCLARRVVSLVGVRATGRLLVGLEVNGRGRRTCRDCVTILEREDEEVEDTAARCTEHGEGLLGLDAC